MAYVWTGTSKGDEFKMIKAMFSDSARFLRNDGLLFWLMAHIFMFLLFLFLKKKSAFLRYI